MKSKIKRSIAIVKNNIFFKTKIMFICILMLMPLFAIGCSTVPSNASKSMLTVKSLFEVAVKAEMEERSHEAGVLVIRPVGRRYATMAEALDDICYVYEKIGVNTAEMRAVSGQTDGDPAIYETENTFYRIEGNAESGDFHAALLVGEEHLPEAFYWARTRGLYSALSEQGTKIPEENSGYLTKADKTPNPTYPEKYQLAFQAEADEQAHAAGSICIRSTHPVPDWDNGKVLSDISPLYARLGNEEAVKAIQEDERSARQDAETEYYTIQWNGGDAYTVILPVGEEHLAEALFWAKLYGLYATLLPADEGNK